MPPPQILTCIDTGRHWDASSWRFFRAVDYGSWTDSGEADPWTPAFAGVSGVFIFLSVVYRNFAIPNPLIPAQAGIHGSARNQTIQQRPP
jgi:hypothetical protein